MYFALASFLVLFLIQPAKLSEIMVCNESYRTWTTKVTLSRPQLAFQQVLARSELECAIKCKKNERCKSAFHSENSGVCFLYDSVNDTTVSEEEVARCTGQRHLVVPKPLWNISPNSPCEIICPSPAVCGRDCTDCDNSHSNECPAPPEPVCWVDTDDCSEEILGNIRQFYIGKTNQEWTTRLAEEHKLQTKVYPKKSPKSGLHVTLFTDFRGSKGCSIACCATLYFKFNGATCPKSGGIDIIHFESDVNLLYGKMEEVDGICEGLAAGDVTIDVYVSNCKGSTENSSYSSHILFASHSYARLMVREVDMSASLDKTKCSALSSFNVKQAFWQNDAATKNDAVAFAIINFSKRLSSTGLRVVWRGQLRELPSHTGTTCALYSLRFNDLECSNPGKIDGIITHYGSSKTGYQMRDHPIGGICKGLGEGNVKIQLWHQDCGGSISPYQGSNSYSRIIVEEVRLNSKISAYVRPDGTSVRVPQFNLAHHYWHSLNTGTTNGQIKKVEYFKLSSRSALKVRWLGTLRASYLNSNSQSCAWYFAFNDVECSNPGPILGSIVMSHTYHNYHQPSVVEGMCELPVGGAVEVSFKVRSVGSCYTGWRSSSNLEISEVHLNTDR